MAKREPTMAEIRAIAVISANEDTVVVGGMAVAILAEYFCLAASEPCMTKDADFLGGRVAIEESEEMLAGYRTRKYLATMDDSASPNAGKLAVDIGDQVEPVEIDFLFRIDGLSTDEIEQKAVTIDIDGKALKVMHPVLLLESKINNLALYPGKRNDAGVNQARLAVSIVRAYMERFPRKESQQRPLLQIIERIARFAARDPACFANKVFAVDALAAIPDGVVVSAEFRETRWPQLAAVVATKRSKFDRLFERMATTMDPKKTRFRV